MEDNCVLRREKIQAREALQPEARRDFSAAIVQRLALLPEYQAAETVMLYRAEGEMIALLPENERAWQKGYCGIPEPVRQRSREIAPEEIDLVICPCTVFDSACRRMGMGKGFYDRFLSRCSKARFVAVAFEAQKVELLSTNPWDVPMDAVITEKTIYRR